MIQRAQICLTIQQTLNFFNSHFKVLVMKYPSKLMHCFIIYENDCVHLYLIFSTNISALFVAFRIKNVASYYSGLHSQVAFFIPVVLYHNVNVSHSELSDQVGCLPTQVMFCCCSGGKLTHGFCNSSTSLLSVIWTYIKMTMCVIRGSIKAEYRIHSGQQQTVAAFI
ncbi:hypothetical protein MATL_G00106480 [Megalops atlanticus]|uniref:Uncharacterized protein n=1 Tax=Megalops atlanticus TaxID=7932 RepID=A0A9D3TC66_MEGAT|nr:hypothetical protein MATL_G00106480 [Megalops atlanticus]